MKTVFVKPNEKSSQYGEMESSSAIEPPIWLAMMASMEDGIVIDLEAEGISSKSSQISRIMSVCPDKVVVLACGSNPSSHIQQYEAAKRLCALLPESLAVARKGLNFDPCAQGSINYRLLNMYEYRPHQWHAMGRRSRRYGATFSSTSCPFTCSFCTTKEFYGSGYKQRDSSLFIKDISSMAMDGIGNIKIVDELFGLDRKYTMDLCGKLSADGFYGLNMWAYARIDTVNPSLLKAMRSAGIRWLAYGIESGDQDVRTLSGKGRFTNEQIYRTIKMTKDAGINVVGNFMFGFFSDTIETMQKTLDMAIKLNCEHANFYCVTDGSGETSQLSPNFTPLSTSSLSGEQVLKFRDAAFKQYFEREEYLSLIGNKFGMVAVSDINKMMSKKIRRNNVHTTDTNKG